MSAPKTQPVDTVLALLQKVKPAGEGWKACCPAHDDHNPSLSIGVGEEGQVLLHCHAGCELDRITSVLGLQVRDLWPETEAVPFKKTPLVISEHRYPIQDETGRLYAYHVRRDRSDGSKKFSWLQPDEKTWTLNGYQVIDLPLYGSHDLPTTANVIVTEGEKAADALRSIGVRAVATVTGAAAVPNPAVLEPLLKYQTVYLWPDNDHDGIRHMRRIAERLIEMGHSDVRRFVWSEAAIKDDAADFVKRGHKKKDVARLSEDAVPWDNTPEDTDPEPEVESAPPRFTLIPFDEYKDRKPPPQLIQGVLSRESIAMLFGESESYKSFLALDMVLHIANGLDWFEHRVEQGHVIYVASEGSAGMAKRIKAWEIYHGYGVENAWIIPDVIALADNQEIDDVIRAIDAAQVEPVAIVIDTLARSADGLDENLQKDMNTLINGATRLQKETGAVPLMIHHTNRQGLYRGSTTLKASMDTMLEMKIEDEHPVLFNYKQKDLEHFPPIHMEVKSVEVTPGHGLMPPERSVVLEQTNISDTANMNQNVRLAWEVLTGEFPEGASNQKWLDAFKSRGGSERSFYRAKQNLIERRHVVATGGKYTAK